MEVKTAFDKWRAWIVALLVLVVAVLSWGVALLNQNIDEVKLLSEQNKSISVDQAQFRDNFSNYMTCLVVNDDTLVIAVGEETYIEICKRLLYRGIDPIPPTIKPDLSVLDPVTTTTTGG